MLQNKLWVYSPILEEQARIISQAANISSLLAKVFLSRGIKDIEFIKTFLNPRLDALHSPFLLKDMDRAVERIVRALTQGEKIIIYGDYDVDGTTSTSILVNFLTSLGADVNFYIPDRLDEGYGLSISALDKVAAGNPALMITVDCGITAIDEVEYITQKGIDVIITDHHECREQLPKALAVVNPHRPDCTYPFKELAGVGVAFKLVTALCSRLNMKEKYLDYIDLVAVGTVADVVPLLDENRIIVKYGLSRIETSKNIGLQSLIDASGLRDKAINAWSIGFGIAPRINAAGRVGDAARAVRLFTTSDVREAGEIAAELNDENKFRQDTEAEIFRQAVEYVETKIHTEKEKLLLVPGEGWHHGVIGIVASKICERYYRPCIMLSCEDGVYKGSGRSIEGFNLFKALTQCENLLEKFGGHELAAGLTLKKENFDAFKAAINRYADEVLTQDDLTQKVRIDAEVTSNDISLEAVKQLELLAPFGAGNPSPIFAFKGLELIEGRAVGADKHAKLKFKKSNFVCEAIGFNMGSELEIIRSMGLMDAACSLEINTWNSTQKVQMNLKDLLPGDEVLMEKNYYSSLDACVDLNSEDVGLHNKPLIPVGGQISEDALINRLEEYAGLGLKTVIMVNSLEGLKKLSNKFKKSPLAIKKPIKICYTNFGSSEPDPIVVLVNPSGSSVDLNQFDRVVIYGSWIGKAVLLKLLQNVQKEKLYSCNLTGGNSTEVSSIVPDRNDLIPVYQYIKASEKERLLIMDLHLFARKISDSYRIGLNYFKVKKSIEIFEELNLLKSEPASGAGMLISIPGNVKGKTNLESSPLYRKLQGLKTVGAGLPKVE